MNYDEVYVSKSRAISILAELNEHHPKQMLLVNRVLATPAEHIVKVATADDDSLSMGSYRPDSSKFGELEWCDPIDGYVSKGEYGRYKVEARVARYIMDPMPEIEFLDAGEKVIGSRLYDMATEDIKWSEAYVYEDFYNENFTDDPDIAEEEGLTLAEYDDCEVAAAYGKYVKEFCVKNKKVLGYYKAEYQSLTEPEIIPLVDNLIVEEPDKGAFYVLLDEEYDSQLRHLKSWVKYVNAWVKSEIFGFTLYLYGEPVEDAHQPEYIDGAWDSFKSYLKNFYDEGF